MKGALILFLVAVFLLLILAYLAQDTPMGKRAGSKAYHMLLLGLMKLDIALAHGMKYMHIMLEHVFCGYHAGGMDAERIHRKEQRMRDFTRQNRAAVEYGRRKHYNRKILN